MNNKSKFDFSGLQEIINKFIEEELKRNNEFDKTQSIESEYETIKLLLTSIDKRLSNLETFLYSGKYNNTPTLTTTPQYNETIPQPQQSIPQWEINWKSLGSGSCDNFGGNYVNYCASTSKTTSSRTT